MDFITKLPIIVKQHDSIMVVVDKLTKETHFILVKKTHKETTLAKIYIKYFAKLHRVPKTIISDRFQSSHPFFGKKISKALGQI
jgi:hypothetical protein